ncbi:MAG: site-2 protease family protein, partial [Bdellovibrionales bacterium]|nr:site-2 protease family protein [Bdellovibrionales bacterium]
PIEGLQSEEIKLSVVAEVDESALVSKEEKENGDVYRIGIRAAVDRVSVPFVDAVIGGHRYVWFLTKLTVSGLAGIFTGSVSADNIAGPIRIIQEAGKSAERGGDSLLRFMIVLSVSLGLLNLLPVPVLDGGHLFFFIIEAVKGSPLSLKVREISNQVGIALLLALMLFAVGNDIWGTLR